MASCGDVLEGKAVETAWMASVLVSSSLAMVAGYRWGGDTRVRGDTLWERQATVILIL